MLLTTYILRNWFYTDTYKLIQVLHYAIDMLDDQDNAYLVLCWKEAKTLQDIDDLRSSHWVPQSSYHAWPLPLMAKLPH